MSRKQAGGILAQRIAAASTKKVARSTLMFSELVSQWQATVLPMYKHSTRKHRSFFATKHLVPRFGDKVVAKLMGHANVDTTLNVYTQVLDGSMRAAVETVGTELFKIVQSPGGASALIH